MLSFADIEQKRANILKKVLACILQKDHVRVTFAQVIDGLPINSTYECSTTMRVDLLSRTTISEHAMDLAARFCESTELLDSIALNPTVCPPFPISFSGTMPNIVYHTGCPAISGFGFIYPSV